MEILVLPLSSCVHWLLYPDNPEAGTDILPPYNSLFNILHYFVISNQIEIGIRHNQQFNKYYRQSWSVVSHQCKVKVTVEFKVHTLWFEVPRPTFKMDLSLSYSPNYFSLEEIIASQIRVPCKTNTKIYGFGFLDPSLSSEDLPPGLELELPLWVAQFMSITRTYVNVNVPRNYKDAFREVLKADARVVDLNKMGPHFYQSGLNICTLPTGTGEEGTPARGEEAQQVAELLPQVLEKRLQTLSDSYSFTATVHSADEATAAQKGTLMKESQMDALEARIYQDARVGSISMAKWLENKAS